MGISIRDIIKKTNVEVTLTIDEGVFEYKGAVTAKVVELYDSLRTKSMYEGVEFTADGIQTQAQERIMQNTLALELGTIKAEYAMQLVEALPDFNSQLLKQKISEIVKADESVTDENYKLVYGEVRDAIYKAFYKELSEVIKESQSGEATPR
jgi:hypothetical protein